MVARAHPESDSATDAGTNRCPQGVPKMSQIRSVGSGNVLHNANHLTRGGWKRLITHCASGLKNVIILVRIFWNVCTVVWTDLLAFFCVLHVQSKGSEECTEACPCRLQQLNLSGSLFIRSRQGLASRQYLGDGRRWTGRKTNLTCCTTNEPFETAHL